ncbi:MAG: uroporphyrinogen-III synthase [Flavobacteriales bacterium]
MIPVFISKDAQDLIPELALLTEQDKITAHSLIEFKALKFSCPEPTDIIFFGSIRAADFFLERCQPSPLIAVAGQETARKLKEKHKLNAGFIAEDSGDPNLEAQNFNQWRGDRTVAFPTSNLSIGTYMKHVPQDQKAIIQVYQTSTLNRYIAEHRVYVFSSPSNVSAFFESNQLPANAILIAWGNSTKNSLQNLQLEVHHTLLKDQQQTLLALLQEQNYL